MARPEVLHVYYVDDDPLAVQAFMALAGEHEGLHVEACDVDQVSGLDGHDTGGPALVLIDLFLRLGGENGIDIAQRVQDTTGFRSAICTVSESPADAARAWDSGVAAYLTKRRLLKCGGEIGTVLRAIADGAIVYDVDPRALRVACPLSAREIEVVARKARGQSHREIAEALFISARTVDSHLSNVRSKLGAASVQDAITAAADLGLVTVPENGGG